MATCQQCNECPPVPAIIPVCANPEYCSELVDSRCVIYTGTDLTSIGVLQNDRLETILQKINTAISLLQVTNP